MKETVNSKLIEMLRSPGSCEHLALDSAGEKLITGSGAVFSIESGIPVMLIARSTDNFDYVKHYTLDAELFDYFEERKGGTAEDERRVREYILSKLQKNSETVLDVGCGRAWLAGALVRKDKFIVSMDVSIANPQKAIELYPSSNHAALVADAFALPFGDNQFDCIVCSEVIEHTNEPDQLIKELYRVVKPGGELIITTPYKEKLRYSLCIHCNQMTPVNSHLHSFDENKLKSYADSVDSEFEWASFGNKALMHLRAHVILKYLPFAIWKLKDNFFNLIINKRAHIIAVYRKGSK